MHTPFISRNFCTAHGIFLLNRHAHLPNYRAPNDGIGLTHFPSLPFHRATIPRSDGVGDLLSDPPPPPHSLQVLSNGVQSSSSNGRSERKWGWDFKMDLFGYVEESMALNHCQYLANSITYHYIFSSIHRRNV